MALGLEKRGLVRSWTIFESIVLITYAMFRTVPSIFIEIYVNKNTTILIVVWVWVVQCYNAAFIRVNISVGPDLDTRMLLIKLCGHINLRVIF